MLLASDSRRSCGYSLGSEHISALGMILKMGVETLWCYAGQYMATPEWVCGVGGRRALGVGFDAQLWAFHNEGAHLGPRDDIENGWGDALVLRWPSFGCSRKEGAEWVGGVLLPSESRHNCGHSIVREHISALGMKLKMGMGTLSCLAGLQLAASGVVCGVGGRRAPGVGFAA